jgi:amino-acid N-acetyltransferase
MLRDIGFEDVQIRRIATECGESCEPSSLEELAVAVTARKPGESQPTVRPAVPADRPFIEKLLENALLPLDGLRIEDAIVVLDEKTNTPSGVVALERFGSNSMLRSLVVEADRRRQGLGRSLVVAALEVARWSGAGEVHLFTEDAQGFFSKFGFEAVSGKVTRAAVPESPLVTGTCCSTATAMRLSFEEADLPLLSKPSLKQLPTFQDGACC